MLSLTAGAGTELVKFYGTNEVDKDRLDYALYYHRKSSLPSTRLFFRKESVIIWQKECFKDMSENQLLPLCKSSQWVFLICCLPQRETEGWSNLWYEQSERVKEGTDTIIVSKNEWIGQWENNLKNICLCFQDIQCKLKSGNGCKDRWCDQSNKMRKCFL